MRVKDFAIVNWVSLVVCIIILGLDGYLIIFHSVLISRDTTTYKHIRAKQRRAKSRVIKKIDEPEEEEEKNEQLQNRDDSLLNR